MGCWHSTSVTQIQGGKLVHNDVSQLDTGRSSILYEVHDMIRMRITMTRGELHISHRWVNSIATPQEDCPKCCQCSLPLAGLDGLEGLAGLAG